MREDEAFLRAIIDAPGLIDADWREQALVRFSENGGRSRKILISTDLPIRAYS
jgi:hypothetical protein